MSFLFLCVRPQPPTLGVYVRMPSDLVCVSHTRSHLHESAQTHPTYTSVRVCTYTYAPMRTYMAHTALHLHQTRRTLHTWECAAPPTCRTL